MERCERREREEGELLSSTLVFPSSSPAMETGFQDPEYIPAGSFTGASCPGGARLCSTGSSSSSSKLSSTPRNVELDLPPFSSFLRPHPCFRSSHLFELSYKSVSSPQLLPTAQPFRTTSETTLNADPFPSLRVSSLPRRDSPPTSRSRPSER